MRAALAVKLRRIHISLESCGLHKVPPGKDRRNDSRVANQALQDFRDNNPS
jgi:hypothetical protein